MVDHIQMNTRVSGWALALLCFLHAGVSSAQECTEDVDCGHGFQCIHESAGTSAVTGVGGSTMPECGDGICEGASEDIDSCPEDCDTIQFCAPAECTANADCAEGYECGAEVGSNSGSTSAGGSSSSVCGDGLCDFDESNTSCPDDCEVYRLCQVAQVVCTSDDDCADGFYCYLEAAASNVAVANVDSGTDTATDGSGGTTDGSGSDSVGSTDAGFAPPATSGGDASGVCLPEAQDTTNGANNATVDGGSVGASNTTAGDTGGNDSNAEGSATDGSGGMNAATGNDSASATDAGAGDTGGASGGDDAGGDDAGCSCRVASSGRNVQGLGLLLLGLAAGLWRRPKRG